MSRLRVTSASLRSVRLRALVPRLALLFLVGILSLAGLRATFADPAAPAAGAGASAGPGDFAARSFAESFARAYLSWDAAHPERRERLLRPYVADTLDSDAGLEPPDRGSQEVTWTSIANVERAAGRDIVTIAALTDDRLLHLSVPVARDGRGLLYLAGYPALVGPPARAHEVDVDFDEESVDDPGLEAVVTRAITNYLAASRENLLADLTPDAVVALPPRPLRTTDTDDVVWVRPGRRVAVEVEAVDENRTSFTLRYELGVQKSDRWYVRSIHVNPLSRGGR